MDWAHADWARAQATAAVAARAQSGADELDQASADATRERVALRAAAPASAHSSSRRRMVRSEHPLVAIRSYLLP